MTLDEMRYWAEQMDRSWSRQWAAIVEETEIGAALSDMADEIHRSSFPPLFSEEDFQPLDRRNQSETIDLDAAIAEMREDKTYLQSLLTDVLSEHDTYLPGEEWPAIARIRRYLNQVRADHGVY